MATFEEILAWSVGEIRNEIEKLCSGGHVRETWDSDTKTWVVTLEQSSESKIRTEVSSDLRIALLGIFGWLWQNHLQSHPNPIWVRKKELTVESVTQAALSIPDPEDLDPVEIEAMYRRGV